MRDPGLAISEGDADTPEPRPSAWRLHWSLCAALLGIAGGAVAAGALWGIDLTDAAAQPAPQGPHFPGVVHAFGVLLWNLIVLAAVAASLVGGALQIALTTAILASTAPFGRGRVLLAHGGVFALLAASAAAILAL